MASASVYNQPWTYREAHPRVKYPPLFSGCNYITFRYVMDSRTLALSTLLLLVAWLVTLLMTCLPFWFELVLDANDGTFGRMQERQRTVINTGIFFMREDHWDNLAALNKYSNVDVVPPLLALAQTCSVLGITVLTGCMAGGLIMMFRRFGSGSGSIFLAAATTVAAIFEILTLVLCMCVALGSGCEPDSDCYKDNLPWQMIPMYSQMYRVEPRLTPFVQVSWAMYIAVIGAVVAVAAAVLLWMEALSTNSSISSIRYQQLQQHQDPHEGDIDVTDGRTKFRYAAPEHRGPGAYGMQPVMINPPQAYQVPGVAYTPQYAPPPQQPYAPQYPPQQYAPPQQYNPPQQYAPRQYAPEKAGFRSDRDTTSYDSSSSVGGKREIDL